MKSATSNLASSWRLPRPVIKSYTEEKKAWPGLGELPKVYRLPFNISSTAEATNFKFGTQLGFAKAHHKVTP